MNNDTLSSGQKAHFSFSLKGSLTLLEQYFPAAEHSTITRDECASMMVIAVRIASEALSRLEEPTERIAHTCADNPTLPCPACSRVEGGQR